VGCQDLAEYREATVAVMELMTTTSTAKLTRYALLGQTHHGLGIFVDMTNI
jgi:hypothetical protein